MPNLNLRCIKRYLKFSIFLLIVSAENRSPAQTQGYAIVRSAAVIPAVATTAWLPWGHGPWLT